MTGPEKLELAAAPIGFIGAWVLENVALCDDLIRLFQESPNKEVGSLVDRYGQPQVRKDDKDSIDVAFAPNAPEPAIQVYLVELQKVVERYVAEFRYCNEFAPWTIAEKVNIQFFPKGGGYKAFHTERVSASPPNSSRHLVFMTYLNDVHDQGGTEFLHQKLTVSARKGLTLIWPVDWTHTHRGIVSETEEKYIITGWFNFVMNR